MSGRIKIAGRWYALAKPTGEIVPTSSMEMKRSGISDDALLLSIFPQDTQRRVVQVNSANMTWSYAHGEVSSGLVNLFPKNTVFIPMVPEDEET